MELSLDSIVEASLVGPISPDMMVFLKQTVDNHLRDLVQEAGKAARASHRDTLTTADVAFALEVRNREALVGFDSAALFPAGAARVNLRQLADEPLPPLPQEAAFTLHWLAVGGVQPAIHANPAPATSTMAAAAGSAVAAGAAARSETALPRKGKKRSLLELEPALPHVLSEEMQSYMSRLTAAVKSGDLRQQRRVFASLRRDPGLEEVLPFVCALLESGVADCLLRTHDLRALGALLRMLRCVLENSHFRFVEGYLHQVLPAVLSVAVTRSLAGNSRWEEHWRLRDAAAALLATVCARFAEVQPQVQPRLSAVFAGILKDPASPLPMLYGALAGLLALGPLAVEAVLVPLVHGVARAIHSAAVAAAAAASHVNVLADLPAAGTAAAAVAMAPAAAAAEARAVAKIERARRRERAAAWEDTVLRCRGRLLEVAGDAVRYRALRQLKLLPTATSMELLPAAGSVRVTPAATAEVVPHTPGEKAAGKAPAGKKAGKGHHSGASAAAAVNTGFFWAFSRYRRTLRPANGKAEATGNGGGGEEAMIVIATSAAGAPPVTAGDASLGAELVSLSEEFGEAMLPYFAAAAAKCGAGLPPQLPRLGVAFVPL